MNYTGFGNANFIAARDGVWFFEKCERFGYNAHPNLLFNPSRKGVGEPLAALIDGSFRPVFSGGFGASVTMTTKESAPGGSAVHDPDRLGGRDEECGRDQVPVPVLPERWRPDELPVFSDPAA